jgi:FixJ family two-component response regulator
LSRSATIAVIDDDESVREALSGLLKSLDHRAVAFACAEDFLNSAERAQVGCLIADVQMPGIGGPELHERLVAAGQSIPIILITAYPDETVKTRVMQAGIKGYLSKPFSEGDLLACIEAALASPKRQRDC